MKKACHSLAIIISVVILSVSAYGQDIYNLSMLHWSYPEKVQAVTTSLAEYLAKETGLSIKPVLPKDIVDYERAVTHDEIHIGYQNPLVYINIDSSHEVIAVAVKGRSGENIRGVVITRADSPILDIDELVHKKIMIVSKTSIGGYISQKITMRDFGVDLEKDTELSVAADNNEENVILSVSVGDVDAGFIPESALHKADAYIIPQSIKILAYTQWLPNWAFSLSKKMPEEHKKKILHRLLKLNENSGVMKDMGLTKFVPVDDSRYDIIRSIMKK